MEPPALPATTDNLISRYALFLSLSSSHSRNELKLKHDEEYFRHLAAKHDTDLNEVIYQVYTELMNIQLVKNMFDSQKLQRFFMHLVAEHLLIILKNTFGGQLEDGRHFSSLLVTSSLFNHSCAPNAWLKVLPHKSVCITWRPIEKGDQIFVTYLAGSSSTKQHANQNFKKLIARKWFQNQHTLTYIVSNIIHSKELLFKTTEN